MSGKLTVEPPIQKVVDETIFLKRPRRGAKLKEEVWQAEDGEVVRYSLAYVNPAASSVDNGRVLGYDNSHNYHHRHFRGRQEPFEFVGVRIAGRAFLRGSTRALENKKIKNVANVGRKPPRVTVASGTVEAFIERSFERAQKLDHGAQLPSEITMTFEDPSDLSRVLSAQRVRVLHAVRARPTPISELAGTLRRDRKAVRRDVSLLESFGLVKTREEPNPGHGRRRVVEPRAAKYQLMATI